MNQATDPILGADGEPLVDRSERDAKADPPADPRTRRRLRAVRSSRRVNARIINGEPAANPIDNDVVAIRFRPRPGVPLATCTGVAISGKAILTAAHCVCGIESTYKVLVGSEVRNSRTFDIERIVKWPTFNCARLGAGQPGRDIALIVLAKQQSELERRVRPIALMGQVYKSNPRPKVMQVYGFGYTERRRLGERRRAFVPVQTLTCAEEAARRARCAVLQEFILSSFNSLTDIGPRTTDSCQGDSGGPVYQIAGNRAYLVGLVSRASTSHVNINGLPCGGGGIYTTVGRWDIIGWLRNEGVRFCLKGGLCNVNSRYRVGSY